MANQAIMLGVALAMLASVPAAAQDGDEQAPRRTRIGLGPQLVPRFPGSEDLVLRPYLDISRTRGDTPFAFEAPDENTGFTLIRDKDSKLAIGPVLGFEGKRRRSDTDGRLDRVGFTIEAGGFIQYALTPEFRVRAEVRHGIGGHEALVGMLSADYVARDADRWLFSLGPRLTFASGKYNRAYFGVTPTEATTSGVPAYRPGSGLVAAGAAASALTQITPRWGVFGYAKYDRLVGDAADSPVTRTFGSRDQFSGGVGLSYTFGRGVD